MATTRARSFAPWLLGISVVLILAIVAALAANFVRLRESAASVQHTNEVLAAISRVQVAALEAESNERGFLITGIASYASTFAATRNRIVSEIDGLQTLVADSAEQTANVERLRETALKRITQLQAVVDLGPGRMQQALDILEQSRIEPLTEQITATLEGMSGIERRLLSDRQSTLDRQSVLTAVIAGGLGLLALISASIAAFLLEHQRALTRQQQADQRLQQLQAELLHVARLGAMGGMSTALAHELNQPLAAMTNYLQGSRRILQAHPDPQARKVATALDKAAQQALRAGAVIQRLRDFVSRGETARTAVSLQSIIDDALALASVDARDRPVNVRIDLDLAVDVVLVDQVQIQQVLLNLIRNAFEAMREQPVRRLSITSAAADDDMVELTISDSGPGIDPAVLARLFQPFSTTKTNGMGVGLSISQTIIQAHGSSIVVTSTPQDGTTFRFGLPLATPSQSRAA